MAASLSAVSVLAEPHDPARAATIRRLEHSQGKAAVGPREFVPDAELLPFPAKVWLVEHRWFGRRSAAVPPAAFRAASREPPGALQSVDESAELPWADGLVKAAPAKGGAMASPVQSPAAEQQVRRLWQLL